MDSFLELSNKIQSWLGGPDIIISLIGTIFSIGAFFHAKSIERRLKGSTGKTLAKSGGNHVVLAVDLLNDDADGMVSQFAGWIRDNRKENRLLYHHVYNIEPLEKSEEISIKWIGDFVVNFVTDISSDKRMGRFITVQGPRMPTDTKSAETYLRTFGAVIEKHLFPNLSSRGVKAVHVIFRGPYVASMYLGTKLANHFGIYYYQWSDGHYYSIGTESIKPESKKKRV